MRYSLEVKFYWCPDCDEESDSLATNDVDPCLSCGGSLEEIEVSWENIVNAIEMGEELEVKFSLEGLEK